LVFFTSSGAALGVLLHCGFFSPKHFSPCYSNTLSSPLLSPSCLLPSPNRAPIFYGIFSPRAPSLGFLFLSSSPLPFLLGIAFYETTLFGRCVFPLFFFTVPFLVCPSFTDLFPFVLVLKLFPPAPYLELSVFLAIFILLFPLLIRLFFFFQPGGFDFHACFP